MNFLPASATLHPQAHRARLQALRSVAMFEFAKGVLAIGALVALHWLVPGDVAGAFLKLLHISPDRHFARFLLNMAERLSNIRFWHLAVGVLCYSGLRFAEAVGLWKARAWAEWVALVSGAIYLPLEARVTWRHPSALHAAVLVINLAIVAFMFYLRIYVPHQEKRDTGAADIQ
ncbi:MAG TPA: DUF2127 domain-containing protein [Terriglobales bacterium]|jgi:uncharacterized membrane protein (DUF2068 family)|nr:DUF2127 domain-containing protein [Terriglobales bacterium]